MSAVEDTKVEPRIQDVLEFIDRCENKYWTPRGASNRRQAFAWCLSPEGEDWKNLAVNQLDLEAIQGRHHVVSGKISTGKLLKDQFGRVRGTLEDYQRWLLDGTNPKPATPRASRPSRAKHKAEAEEVISSPITAPVPDRSSIVDAFRVPCTSREAILPGTLSQREKTMLHAIIDQIPED